MGCHQINPIKPTKPNLMVNKQPNGGMCLDKENTKALGNYILELERGYQ